MSANSSKKPSKLLQKKKGKCWRGTKEDSDIENGQKEDQKETYEPFMHKHLLEPLRGEKVEQMKQFF